jgi:N-acetylmuramoyl-L-alanine amidase CwlA
MKNKIIEHLKVHRIKYILGLVFMLFVGGVSFKKILDKHTRKRKDKVEYIIVHYTANLHPNASAEMNAMYLRNKRAAGCHYAIDDEEIIQCVPEDQVAYSVGDRKWLGFVPKPWLKGKIFNENSISYEMCLGGGRNDSLIVDMTARCVAWQMINKGFLRNELIQVYSSVEQRKLTFLRKVPDMGRVVRHHDVSGKHCPKFFYNEPWNQAKEDKAFYKFKLLVDKYVRQKIDAREIQ